MAGADLLGELLGKEELVVPGVIILCALVVYFLVRVIKLLAEANRAVEEEDTHSVEPGHEEDENEEAEGTQLVQEGDQTVRRSTRSRKTVARFQPEEINTPARTTRRRSALAKKDGEEEEEEEEEAPAARTPRTRKSAPTTPRRSTRTPRKAE